MLVEIAIGDAYAVPFEFAPMEFIREHNDLSMYHDSHRSDWDLSGGIGQYTDDTQMSIGVCNTLLKHYHLRKPMAQDYIEAFKYQYQFDKVRGYSKRIVTGLDSPYLNSLNEVNGHFTSNGAVMRAVPVGLLATPEEVIAQTIIHVSTTHCSLEAIDSACFIALSAHYLYHEIGDIGSIYIWLGGVMGDEKVNRIRNSWWGVGEVECDAMQTAAAALYLTYDDDDTMSQILKNAVAVGGDTDSVAAIALGLASLTKTITNDLPEHFYKNLRNDGCGLDYLKRADARMYEMFPKNLVVRK